jgi:hypothetical protein
MEITLCDTDVDGERDDAADAQCDRRGLRIEHVGVEDDRRIGPPLVRREPVESTGAPDLLLALYQAPNVDRKLALLREFARDEEDRVEVAFVVARPRA